MSRVVVMLLICLPALADKPDGGQWPTYQNTVGGGGPVLLVADKAPPIPGAVVIQPGDGAISAGVRLPAGKLVFLYGDGKEALRFEPNGDCFVRGEKVDSNKKIWIALGRWLRRAKISITDKAGRRFQ